MGTDISEGAKIGIILIILCSLVAIVFSLLTMMKNITNSGSASFQNGLDQLQDSEFQDYDQKILTGTQVVSAIKIFDGRPLGFLVETKASGADNAVYAYGCILTGATEGTIEPASVGKVFSMPKTTAEHKANVTDSWYTIDLQTNQAGTVSYNTNVKPLSQTATKTFVRSSAKFLAEIIKDNTGTKVGVKFTQQEQ